MAYGWRAKIGFLAPPKTFDPYPWDLLLPEGVGIIGHPLGLTHLTPDEVRQAWTRTDDAIRELARRQVDIIVLGGSPPVIVGGFGFDQKFIEQGAKIISIPVTTTQTAAVEAMQHLGMKRIAVAAPFTDEFCVMLRDFLEKSGFQVLSLKNRGFGLIEADQQPLSVSYRLGKDAFAAASQADGLYIPRASFPVVENIELLEQDLKVPVVTSAQAVVWSVCCKLRIGGPIRGYGRLLGEL